MVRMYTPEELRRDPLLFIKLMEEYNITPKDLGISAAYKSQIRSGYRKPSLELCNKLLKLISKKHRIVAARSQLEAAARPLGPHGQPQRGRLNFRVRYEPGCCPATMAGSGRQLLLGVSGCF